MTSLGTLEVSAWDQCWCASLEWLQLNTVYASVHIHLQAPKSHTNLLFLFALSHYFHDNSTFSPKTLKNSQTFYIFITEMQYCSFFFYPCKISFIYFHWFWDEMWPDSLNARDQKSCVSPFPHWIAIRVSVRLMIGGQRRSNAESWRVLLCVRKSWLKNQPENHLICLIIFIFRPENCQ